MTTYYYYYYRVTEFVTTFGADGHHSFDHTEEFKGDNLLDCRKGAMEYFKERKNGMPDKYHLPFATPSDFEFGRNAAYSISLDLVECYGGEEYDHPLYGCSPEEDLEGRKFEASILAQ